MDRKILSNYRIIKDSVYGSETQIIQKNLSNGLQLIYEFLFQCFKNKILLNLESSENKKDDVEDILFLLNKNNWTFGYLLKENIKIKVLEEYKYDLFIECQKNILDRYLTNKYRN